MSIFNYKSQAIFYREKGQKSNEPPLLFLHGWGPDSTSFDFAIDALSDKYHIYALDFPGFGQSPEPKEAWNLDAYTDMVAAFITDNNLKTPILIGHSFGGRVSIKLSQRMALSQMVLVDSAGIKPPRPWHYYLKIYTFKGIRKLSKLPFFHFILKEPLNAYAQKYSSEDYKNASPMMKRILSIVVNEDLSSILENIKVPTLLIWGEHDTATPLADAKLMTERIKDSGLVVFEGAGHFSFTEQPSRFITILDTFIGG